ncbi:MAG: FHA domain-containing protein [Rhodospirillaceae bacterium]
MMERDALLFNQALHKLGAIQARKARVHVHERYDALAGLFRQLLDLAKNSNSLAEYAEALPTMGLTYTIRLVTERLPVGDHTRAITYAVARYFGEARDWNLKLQKACELFEIDQSDEAADCLDEVITEIIDGNEPVKAVLGYAPDLVTALNSMLAIIHGTWDERMPGTQVVKKLSDIMSHRPLPLVRSALLGRIASAIAGKAPLTKLDRSGNCGAFKRLVPKLMEFGGFMGGSDMAAAVTIRAKVVFGNGEEDASFEETVLTLSGGMPSPAAKIGYLLDLLSSEMGKKKASYLSQRIAEMFSRIHSIHDFAPDLDVSWSHDMVREDFRVRLCGAGIPRKLADELLRKVTLVSDQSGLAVSRSDRTMTGCEPGQMRLSSELSPESLLAVTPARLMLTYRGLPCTVDSSQTPFVIGRSDTCQLIVDWGAASRNHAVIKFVNNDFVLFDQSKNGTQVCMTNHASIALANSSTVLKGEGRITIGTMDDTSEAQEYAVIKFQRI